MSEHLTAQTQTTTKPSITPIATSVLQRQCACGQHTSAGGECEECKQKREGTLQRAAISPSPVHDVPPIVHEVLRSSGQPLDAATRAFMEPRFGFDFSHVRINRDVQLDEWAGQLRGYLERGTFVYGYFNNHYQGHSPASVRALQGRLAGLE